MKSKPKIILASRLLNTSFKNERVKLKEKLLIADSLAKKKLKKLEETSKISLRSQRVIQRA